MTDLFAVNRFIIQPKPVKRHGLRKLGFRKKGKREFCHDKVTGTLMLISGGEEEKKTPTVDFHLICSKYRVRIKTCPCISWFKKKRGCSAVLPWSGAELSWKEGGGGGEGVNSFIGKEGGEEGGCPGS